ncbi:MAG TPA: hypothetical protein VG371_00730 [Solirubrobacteraceae bacterium]|jgi:hypothetical protein|nr:hypothetical protein [Solirubrobacteraceae bacterium]
MFGRSGQPGSSAAVASTVSRRSAPGAVALYRGLHDPSVDDPVDQCHPLRGDGPRIAQALDHHPERFVGLDDRSAADGYGGVVLPRGVPARLARFTFLAVRGSLLLRLRLSGRSDYKTRDRVFALQAPLGLFAQLVAWSLLIFLCFGALFWALSPPGLTGASIAQALELSGSSMVTLGIDHPQGWSGSSSPSAPPGWG